MCRETSALKNMGVVVATINLMASAIRDISNAVTVGN